MARPAPIAATLVLALNDHVLKGSALSGWATGKLSDLAGLFVATILAVTIARACARLAIGHAVPRDGRLGAAVAVAILIAFAALKLWPAFNASVEAMWGVNQLDPTDLCALPSIALAWLWLRDREHADAAPPRRFLGGLALVGIALACIATPAPPPVPPRPVAGWSVRDATLVVSCGKATAWVSKSGKSGFGLTVRMASGADEPCGMTIAAARTRFPDGTEIAGREIAIVQPTAEAIHAAAERRTADYPTHDDLARGGVRYDYHYVAFELDNNARWNAGHRTAHVELEVDVAGERARWTMRAVHAFVTFDARRR